MQVLAMVSFDGPRILKEIFMIISFQMLSQLANKRCVLLLDTNSELYYQRKVKKLMVLI